MASRALSDTPGSFHRHTLQQGWKIGYSDRAVQITMKQLSGQSSNKCAIVFTVTLMAKRAEVGKGKGGSLYYLAEDSLKLTKQGNVTCLSCFAHYGTSIYYYIFTKKKKSQSACLASCEIIPNFHAF